MVSRLECLVNVNLKCKTKCVMTKCAFTEIKYCSKHLSLLHLYGMNICCRFNLSSNTKKHVFLFILVSSPVSNNTF